MGRWYKIKLLCCTCATTKAWWVCVRLSPSPSGTHPCPSSGQGLHGLICQGPPLICRGDPRGQGSVLTLRKECVCMYERACVSVCECDTGRRQACMCTASIYKAPQDPGHPQSAQFSLFHLPLHPKSPSYTQPPGASAVGSR